MRGDNPGSEPLARTAPPDHADWNPINAPDGEKQKSKKQQQ